MMMKPETHTLGFTLIELSIVLVIIGFIVGGVLAGHNLIAAAAVRAQISQIEKFNTAVNTFRGKYGFLPGDIPPASVIQFGFTAAPGTQRGGTPGQGDGNGIIEGWSYISNFVNDTFQTGEPLFFWEDLSVNSNLIDSYIGYYPNGSYYPTCGAPSCLALYFPQAKIGPNNYVMAFSRNGVNYFTITETTFLQNDGNIQGTVNLTVQQAASIDQKIDDGYPQMGRVLAQYLQFGYVWAGGGGVAGASPGTAATGSPNTCYDDGGNASNPMVYSVSQSNGANVNCGLSFQFQ